MLVSARPRGSVLLKGNGIKLRGMILLQDALQWPYWSKFWSDWNWEGLIRPAIDLCATLGANCIRLNGDGIADRLGSYPADDVFRDRINQLCNYAASKNLLVFWQLGYQPKYSFGLDGAKFNEGVASCVKVVQWLNTVQNVIAIDIMNEWNYSQPTNWGGSATGTGLSAMTSYMASTRAVTSLPLTISVGGRATYPNSRLLSMTSAFVQNVAPLVDFHDIRCYYADERATPSLDDIKEMKAAAWYRGAFVIGECSVDRLGFSPFDRTRIMEGIGTISTDRDSYGAFYWGLTPISSVPGDPTNNINASLEMASRAFVPYEDVAAPFKKWPAQS